MELQKLREKLDEIDSELVKLLSERAGVALQVREAKRENNHRVYAPEREREILDRVAELAGDGPFPQAPLKRIFLNILSATRALVGDMKVCCAGEKYSICHSAGLQQFGEHASYQTAASDDEVFDVLERGGANFGVVAAETLSTGMAFSLFRRLMKSDLEIVSEILLSESSARCLVLGDKGQQATGNDKTSMACAVDERSGALRDLLLPFADNGITLLKIESRRIQPYGVVFFIDFAGHKSDAESQAAIKGVTPLCSYAKVLGSYPAAT